MNRWTDRLRTLTQDAVKHGAAAISHSVPPHGHVGKLLRKLADEPAAPVRTALRVYHPGQRQADAPVHEHGGDRETACRSGINGGAEAAADPIVLSTAGGAFPARATALPARAPERSRPELAAGVVIADRYEITRVLAHGPAHRVYAARHREWDVEVALKLPRADVPWLGTRRDVAADALRWTGLGLHPHVVYCHYVDRLDGLPILVLEHRAGGTLRPWISSGRTANLRIGLNLAVQICHGLERAHRDGVCHGGLRPENLLFGEDGLLAVSDFGITATAALLRAEGDGPAVARRRELEPYVAPEQWVDPAALEPAADVFALGVCLYEMFTGRRPYEIARGPRREALDPLAYAPELPPALGSLLRRCVDWEVARRPAGAADVRDELCAVHEALFGRPSPFAAVADERADADGWNNQAVALLLLGHIEQAEVAWAQALAAVPAHLEATYNAAMRRWRDGLASDAAVIDAVAHAVEQRTDRADGVVLLAGLHLQGGDPHGALARLDTIPEADLGPAGHAMIEAAQQTLATAAGQVAIWDGHRGYVSAVAVLGGASRVLSASDDGTLAVWTAGQSAPSRLLSGHGGPVVAVCADGEGQIGLSTGEDATVRQWDLATGRCLQTITLPGRAYALGANRTLSRAVVACSGSDTTVGVDAIKLLAWDLQRGRMLAELKGHTTAVKCVALNAEGTLAISGGEDQTLRLWDLAQGGGCRRVLNGHEHYVSAVAMSADGELVVSGSWDTTLRVWDLRRGRCLRVLRGHEGIVTAVALSAGGEVAISAGWDRTVRVWDVASGRCLKTFAGHEAIAAGVALSPDGMLAASGGWDRTVRLWRVPARTVMSFTPRLSRRVCYARLPSPEPDASEWLDGGEAALREGRVADALAAARAARRVITPADAVRTAQLWRDLAPHCARARALDLSLVAHWKPRAPLTAVWPLADGDVLEAARSGAVCRAAAGGSVAAALDAAHEGRVLACAVAEETGVAVSAGADTRLRVWDLAAGSCRGLLAGHTSLVAAVALAADARLAVSGAYDHMLRLWDLDRCRCARILSGHARQVTAVSLDALATRAASGDYGGAVHVWDLADGRCVQQLAAHRGAVVGVRLIAGASAVLSAGVDGVVRRTELDTGAGTVVCARSAPWLALDVSSDQRWAVAVAGDGAVWVTDLAGGAEATFALDAPAPLASASAAADAGRIAGIDRDGAALLAALEWDLEPR